MWRGLLRIYFPLCHKHSVSLIPTGSRGSQHHTGLGSSSTHSGEPCKHELTLTKAISLKAKLKKVYLKYISALFSIRLSQLLIKTWTAAPDLTLFFSETSAAKIQNRCSYAFVCIVRESLLNYIKILQRQLNCPFSSSNSDNRVNASVWPDNPRNLLPHRVLTVFKGTYLQSK